MITNLKYSAAGGEKLYSTNDVDGYWDGKYQGKSVPAGIVHLARLMRLD